ncbi:MAG TPA: hypothetical protein VN755_10450 [Steroidobacteraceae bacterium]|nr:hypothetical protein [Steroidobacteraceae bacterium]
MPLKRSLAFLAALHSVASPAFEIRWTQGLQVSWEQMPGRTSVGGMSLLIRRATGRDVALLAQRILEDWRRESGMQAVKLLNSGGWSIGTRIHQGRSQVTQWRVSGEASELLWSESDLNRQLLPMPVPQYLVPACTWTGPIRGTVAETTYSQSTGRCTARPSTVLAAIETALGKDGWQIRRSASGLNASRINTRLQVILIPAEQRSRDGGMEGGSAAVILEVRSSKGPAP